MSSRTPVVELHEDQPLPVSAIVDQIANQVQEDFSPIALEDHVLRFFEHLNALFGELERVVYADLDVEAPPPTVDALHGRISPGQWIGWFEMPPSELSTSVLFAVRPKVGAEAFSRMMNEVMALMRAIGLPTVRFLWENLFGATSPTFALAHSYELARLTELALLEGLPHRAVTEHYVAEGLVGRPDVARTQKEQARGRPVVVSRRTRVLPGLLPRLFLIKFHALLLRDLERWKGEYAENPVLLPVVDRMEELARYHREYLSDDESLSLFDKALGASFEDEEFLDQLRTSLQRREWLERIVDQYVMYLGRNRVGQYLMDRSRTELPIQPVPSSKVYELWILKLVLDNLLRRARLRFRDLARAGRAAAKGVVYRIGEMKVGYNVSDPRQSYILGRLGRSIRPDLMIARNGGRAVVDAKYRDWSNVQSADLERLLAYLVDYSQPQSEAEVKGFLVLLSHVGGFEQIGERLDLVPPIRLFSLEADPTRPQQATRNIDLMCSRIVG